MPLALIPQILFSGFVVALPEMPESARVFSHFVPSSSAQRLVDLANIAGKRVPLMAKDTEIPMFFWTDEQLNPFPFSGSYSHASDVPDKNGTIYTEIDEYNTSWQNWIVDVPRLGRHDPTSVDPSFKEKNYIRKRSDIAGDLKAGSEFNLDGRARPAALGLLLWSAFCYLIIWLGLSLAQPAPLRPRWLQR